MTPRQRSWVEIALVVIALCGLLGGIYAYGSSRDGDIRDLRGDVKRLEEHDEALNKRLDRFEGKIDLLLERGAKK